MKAQEVESIVRQNFFAHATFKFWVEQDGLKLWICCRATVKRNHFDSRIGVRAEFCQRRDVLDCVNSLVGSCAKGAHSKFLFVDPQENEKEEEITA